MFVILETNLILGLVMSSLAIQRYPSQTPQLHLVQANLLMDRKTIAYKSISLMVKMRTF